MAAPPALLLLLYVLASACLSLVDGEPVAFGKKEDEMRPLHDFANVVPPSVPAQPSLRAINVPTLKNVVARDPAIDISFIFQYFKNPFQVDTLLKGVLQCVGPKSKHIAEVLVHVDDATPESATEWHKAANRANARAKSLGHNATSVTLVFENNAHEIRGYNRLALMARGRLLFLMQDDDKIDNCGWMEQTISIFDKFPHVGLVGTNVAQTLPCSVASTRYWCSAYRHAKLKLPMQFIGCVDIGPLVARRSAFIDVGGFDEGISPPGFPGIGLDFDISIRMWLRGWPVIHFPAQGINRHSLSPKNGQEVRNTQGAGDGIRGKLWSHAGDAIMQKYKRFFLDEDKYALRKRIAALNTKYLQPATCEDTQKPAEPYENWLARLRSTESGLRAPPPGRYYTGLPLWHDLAGIDKRMESWTGGQNTEGI